MKYAAALFLILSGQLAEAAPVQYVLDRDNSSVAFTYTMNGAETQGRMPIDSADIALDFDTAANSTATVTLDVSRAKAGLIFATKALKSASVLDTARFPTVRFQSTAFQADGDRATVRGLATLRGVTRPFEMEARIYRQKGTEAGDRSRLTVHLKGTVSRAAFGATGYQSFVDDAVTLNIVARLQRAAG